MHQACSLLVHPFAWLDQPQSERVIDIENEARIIGRSAASEGGDFVDRMTFANPQDIHRVLELDRECPRYYRWLQGLSHREHREIVDRELWREWLVRRQDEDREFREKQRCLDAEWRQQQAREEATWRLEQERHSRARFRWELLVFGILVTAVLAAAELVSAFISKGSIP